ncbi:hypothetical protein G4G27_01875 [Sphingomonas sp. So64.6b]|uniref:hypothetical protein n=1 Tax=Sphingomonas sp. So64.6b TaxID=2997354 RepID=UPI001602AC4D|nr:hypothetical protein [Sphingomonas sp. So64.6b]QNA82898.1 hypothetical protein G4G27_01875 [Sphingomonas sp. So64.6b]
MTAAFAWCVLDQPPDGKALLARIGKRPGFDKTALRRAMKSTRNERFTVWQRDLIADKSKTR